MKRVIVGLAIVTVLWCSAAQADAIFTLGNHPQPDEQNILFNNNATGSTVSGVTDISDTIVDFSSTTDTLVVTAGGQAKVTALDNLINDIKITVPGATFLDLIINPFGIPAGSPSATVAVVTNDGIDSFTYSLGNGNNFLTITTSGGEIISSVTIDSAIGFEELRQPRISGLVSLTPEPATLLLLGSGLLGFGLLGFWGGRKKFKI